MMRLPQMWMTSCALAACFAIAETQADVIDMSPNGFTISASAATTAAPADVYRTLTRSIAKWWDPDHTWSGRAANLSLDARAGGCLCERLPPNGSVQHGVVVYAMPAKILRLNAALGPLQEMPVSGMLTFDIKPAERGSTILLRYRVAGGLTIDAAKLAPAVDQVLSIQLQRLARFADGGNPAPADTPQTTP
jgi:uncharacterized protein YndB with AHSA1/START domain